MIEEPKVVDFENLPLDITTLKGFWKNKVTRILLVVVFTNLGSAAGKTLYNTNRRLLGSYRGADGIKTGYTRAAGFNLVASAEREGERIIATVFGGSSVSNRNAQVADLLDLGFRRAPSRDVPSPWTLSTRS